MSGSLSLPVDRFDTEVLGLHWIPLPEADENTAAVLRERLGVDFPPVADEPWESGGFAYFPVTFRYPRGESLVDARVVLALGADFVVTRQPAEPFVPFDAAVAEMARTPALTRSPHGVLYALLRALNETSERVVAHAADDVDALAGLVGGLSGGAGALRDVSARLDRAERTVAQVRETQRGLARAARHLRAVHAGELGAPVAALLAAIEAADARAQGVQDRVRHVEAALAAHLALRRTRLRTLLALCAAGLVPLLMILGYLAFSA
ncbi:hypothetical protein IU433_04390 [Nocardia puris]|uniref:CorA family divalent cation transporter n=1 Tax=Nocardia puris TaxID=208602 RepID=UPI001895D78C|nr:CorA family divalent cation transporter [Nocardia puris]MBF6209808.1 hypothetical protein [Nocardia puris]MBF6366380.1 hypothetical protein [Nocardia puris]MBF6458281.1 hypothetical protein [Nocardia puris]